MKRLILSLLLPIIGLGIVLAPATASAWDPFQGACSQGGGSSAVCTTHSSGNPISGSNGLLTKIANIIALIAGVAAVIIIIVAALHYVTSDGDSKAAGEAKNAIIYALVGLAVIVVARTLIEFVVSRI